jgi:cobalt-zinc-cadmium efflux system protein
VNHGHAEHVHAHEQARQGHTHAPAHFGRAFAIAALLNIALVIAQVIYGVLANSVALLADAGHNFGDVLGLLLAWAAHVAARQPPTKRYTYGFRSASILAALLNALLLLVATGAIAWEAIRRLAEPGDVAGATVMLVAGIGIAVNGASAWLLMAGRKGDLNIRGAFLHLLGDAAVSAGVVVAAAGILWQGWNWLDPAASLVISVVIVWSSWGLLRDALKLSLNAVPAEIDPSDVRGYLETLPGVTQVHDLHIWAISTTETALSCHLVMPAGHPGDAFFAKLSLELHDRFEIGHPTVQIEIGDRACALAPEHVV